ncbi:MAG: hypothetical protein FJ038_09955 [Chloroflexi bacterium]|nr:hypothetical protein [Chloroflexota bacterium]
MREFLQYDDWEPDRSTGHDFFEKVLPDGEILRTHAYRSLSKTISPGRFKAILADQLQLSERGFREVLRTREPAARPSPTAEPGPVSLPLWLAQALEREARLSRDEIAALDLDAARQRLEEVRARPRD